MKTLISLKWVLLLVCVGVIVLWINADKFVEQNKDLVQAANVIQVVEATTTPLTITKSSTEEAKVIVANTSKPKLSRLIISSINVDAPIERLGLTKEGAMDSPAGPINTGWYKYGPKPGDIGSATIAGHFGWKNGIPAVFDNLSKIKIGDKIKVIDENGVTVTFIVMKTKIMANDADATEVFSSNDGKAHLNLITCSGKWDAKTQNRPNRLVVFADKAV